MPAKHTQASIDEPRFKASLITRASVSVDYAARYLEARKSAFFKNARLGDDISEAALSLDSNKLAALMQQPRSRYSSMPAMLSALDSAREGNFASLELLLAHGGDPELPEMDNLSETPLSRAINDAQFELALLLAPRSRIRHRDPFGRTPLLLACARMPELVETLLELGASPRACDIYGFGPLETAAIAGRAELLEILVGRGARLALPDGASATALAVSAMLGYEDCALSLSRLGARLDGRASWRAAGNSCQVAAIAPKAQTARQTPAFSMIAPPLHWAAYHGFEKLLVLCLERHAQMMDEACRLNAPPNRFASFLRSAPSNPLHAWNWGPSLYTPMPQLVPLALSAMGGSAACAEILRAHGASVVQATDHCQFNSLPEIAAHHVGAQAAQDFAKAFPLDPAQELALWRSAPNAAAACHAHIAPELLEERRGGLTVFLRACELGAGADAIGMLAKMGADIHATSDPEYDNHRAIVPTLKPNGSGHGALALACADKDSAECVKTLLALGLDPMKKTPHGQLPIEMVRFGPNRTMLAVPAIALSETAFGLLAHAMLEIVPDGPQALIELIDASSAHQAGANIFIDSRPYSQLRAHAASALERGDLDECANAADSSSHAQAIRL